MNQTVLIRLVIGVVVIVVSIAVIVAVVCVFSLKHRSTPTEQTNLVGNFKILSMKNEVTRYSSVCSYLTAILNDVQLATTNCTITYMSSGTQNVRVSYKLTIEYAKDKDEDIVLKNASSAVALNSSDTSVFHIDQSSITFEEKNGAVRSFCTSQTSCSNYNAICISVVGDYVCACKIGSTRNGNSGSCSNDCSIYQYSCKNGPCIPKSSLCDGYKDCTLGDDETPPQCTPKKSRYCQPTGTWIIPRKICDQYQDCPDDSDEINCTCSKYQYRCNNGRCISNLWLCDGVKDCPLGDDETPAQCSQCNATQFLCGNPHSCIASTKQCNGISDCLDSSDESHCLSLSETGPRISGVKTRLVTATYQGRSGYYICADNWNNAWSDNVCKQMGYSNSLATGSQSVNGLFFLAVDPSTTSSKFMATLRVSSCSSRNAFSISCQAMECGRRAVSQDSVGPYILDGQRAARGAWPWQVVVWTGAYDFLGRFKPAALCGGVLLNDRWILTAGHCTVVKNITWFRYKGTTKPQNILIQLGLISLLNDSDVISSTADRVYTHPSYNSSAINNDVGLIRLSQPVRFTETVQPICLAAEEEDLNRFRVCVNTGYGRTLRNEISQDLLQARMNIISNEECGGFNKNLQNDTQLCVAIIPLTGSTGICFGDSGGPLSCQDANGIWTVIGVNSYVVGTGFVASTRCRLSVVARVSAFTSWIQTTISTNSI